jgi:Na+-driven multidrug efflux pump
MLFSQITGTAVNSVLDPILIFGLFGLPSLGARGAAYATIIGQSCAALIALFFNFKRNGLLFENILKEARFSWQYAFTICKIGIPTSTVGIAASIGNYYINRILIGFFDTANAAFGIYTKLQSVALIPTQGIGSGLVTMIAFFLGKKDSQKIKKSIKAGLVMIGVWGTICFIGFVFFPKVLFMPFNPTKKMLEVGLPAFRIIGITYLISGYMLVLNSFFQATGRSIFSLAVSVSRQILVRVPVAYLLAKFDKINLIWWCWPISEIVSDIVTLLIFIYAYSALMKLLGTQRLLG